MGKGFSGMPSMLYLRKYSVLIIWKWPHRTIMQMVQHLFILQFEIFAFFFIPAASAFIMTDVLQGKIPTTMQKSFLFPKRISILFLNLFGWSKSSGHDLTLRKCSGGLRVYCAKIQIYPVTCEICHQLFRRFFFLNDGGYPFHWCLKRWEINYCSCCVWLGEKSFLA